jgi:hypothetical protein
MVKMNRNISRRNFLKLSSILFGSAAVSLLKSNGSTMADGLSAKGSTTPGAKQGKNKSTPETGSGNDLSGPGSGNPDFVATEITGLPTMDSITIHVIPIRSMNICYEYGTVQGQYPSRTASQPAQAGVPLQTVITGLKPDSRYFFRIRYDDVSGPEKTFVTARAAGTSFRFGIQGDSHPERVGKQFDGDLYSRMLGFVGKDQLDFYLTCGDDFSVDSLHTVNADTVKAVYLKQRQWLESVEAPIFLVNGNHEQASMANLDGTANNVAVWAQSSRNSLFPQPAPDGFYTGDEFVDPNIGQLRDYYAYTWGDALFVVLDPYWHSPVTVDNQYGSGHDPKGNRDLWQVTIGDEQYTWFKQVLETSKARHKFVFCHHVLGTQRGGIEIANKYEWGDDANLSSHRPSWTKSIHRLMADNHVTIFFQGHDHIFVKQELDGVIYQTLPCPADPNYALMNDDRFLTGDKLPGSGYIRVSVSPAEVLVEYIRVFLPADEVGGQQSGEVAYSYKVSGAE